MGIIVSYVLIVIYLLSLSLILLYSLSILGLLINYVRRKRFATDEEVFDLNDSSQVPYVTVQLPLYNERYVVKRLLDNISRLSYPKEKLEIQVLDDSTDDSVEQTQLMVTELKEKGFDVSYIHRTSREGFKAGALKEGTAVAKGDFIAIFDADFMPCSDWLNKTVIYFKDPSVGVVQTRWGHINRNYSLLTKIQALALDTHFTIEQVGRNVKGYFINFNGTAGIWRKQCILDAGNWQGDTLTEDLDLSYRAQLKNWKFKYLEQVETPAELPVVMSAARSQQFRWNKGGAENFRKTAFRVLSSKNISLAKKFHAMMHLLNSSVFLFVFIVSILSVPMLYIKGVYGHLAWIFHLMSVFIVSTIILFFCYWVIYRDLQGKSFDHFLEYIKLFVLFFSVALGLSFHNSIAVLEGHLGKRSEFVRTPKFNISSIKDSWKGNKYINSKLSYKIIIEFLLMIYFIFGLYLGIKFNDFGMFPFHLMLSFGFGFVFFKSLFSKI